MIPTPVVLCIPIFAFLYFTSFSTTSQEWISYSTFLFPSPPILSSLRQIEKFNLIFANMPPLPFLPWRHQGGWHHSHGGSKLEEEEEERVQFFFDVWIRFFIYSIFYSRLFYIRGCDEMEVSAHLWPPLPGVSCWADFSPKASPVLQNLKKNLMVQK